MAKLQKEILSLFPSRTKREVLDFNAELFGSDTSCGMVNEVYQDNGNSLPFNITKDLHDLQVALDQLKANVQLSYDQAFCQKMVDYLDNYTHDYNGGKLTPNQRITDLPPKKWTIMI